MVRVEVHVPCGVDAQGNVMWGEVVDPKALTPCAQRDITFRRYLNVIMTL